MRRGLQGKRVALVHPYEEGFHPFRRRGQVKEPENLVTAVRAPSEGAGYG